MGSVSQGGQRPDQEVVAGSTGFGDKHQVTETEIFYLSYSNVNLCKFSKETIGRGVQENEEEREKSKYIENNQGSIESYLTRDIKLDYGWLRQA